MNAEQALSAIRPLLAVFRERSEIQQGYIHVKFMGVTLEWGSVRWRYLMSGGPDGECDFNSPAELVEIVQKLADGKYDPRRDWRR